MKRHRNLVHSFAIELNRSRASANECARFDRSAQTNNRNVIAIADLEFACELGRDFREQFRLQLRKMTQKARHTSGGMMLGQPVSGKNKRKSRLTRRRESIFLAGEPMYGRVRVARVKRVVHRRLEWLVVRWHRSIFQTTSDIKPPEAVFMQNKSSVAGNRIKA